MDTAYGCLSGGSGGVGLDVYALRRGPNCLTRVGYVYSEGVYPWLGTMKLSVVGRALYDLEVAEWYDVGNVGYLYFRGVDDLGDVVPW